MKTVTALLTAMTAALTAVVPLYAQTSAPPAKIILEQTISTNRCYVGEALPLIMSWHVHPQLGRFKAVNIRIPVMETNRFRIYDSHKTADKPNASSLGIPLSGTRAIANLSTTIINGSKYTTLKIKKIIIPDFAGTQTVASASISCAMTEKNMPMTFKGKPSGTGSLYQYPLYFNNNFFDLEIGPKDIRLHATSKPLSINVLPLPPAPSPLFNGLVGQYDFTLNIHTNTIRQGDPLSLDMTVSSKGRIEHVKLPPLELQTGFTNNFRITSDRHLISIDGRRIVFSQTVYPLHTGRQTIPPLSLHYFNPVTKQYAVSKSEEIQFTVKKAHIIDGSVFGQQNEIEKKHRFWLWIILAAAIASITAILRRKKAEDIPTPVIADPDHAIQQFSKAVTTIENTVFKNKREQYNALNTALGSYLSTKLTACRPGAITLTDLEQLLISKEADDTIINSSRNLYRKLNQYRFAPPTPAATAKTTITAAKDLIHKIHNL